MVIDKKFICHFVDPDLWINIFFEQERETNSECVDFEMWGWGSCCTLLLSAERNFMQNLSNFLLLIWWKEKEQNLKAFLTPYFLVLSIGFFWSALLCFRTEEKIYNKGFVLVFGCLEVVLPRTVMNNLGEEFALGVWREHETTIFSCGTRF